MMLQMRTFGLFKSKLENMFSNYRKILLLNRTNEGSQAI